MRTPAALEAFFDEVGSAAGADARLDGFVRSVRDQLTEGETLEVRARRVVESLALALEASLLVRYAPPAVADAFCASRLAGDRGLEYGTLPAGTDFASIVERHTPAS
jgi:putative acyl-CoA dehydrogenase